MPAVVNATGSIGGAGTSMVVNMPATPTVGNLLVMILGFWTTAPTGGLTDWTLQDVTADAGSMRIGVYTRVVSGSEASTYTPTGYASDDPRCALVVQISGHNGFGAVASAQDSESPWTVGSITTTADGDLVISAVYSQAQTAGRTISWSAGTPLGSMVESGAVGGWRGFLSAVAEVKAVTGATTPPSATPQSTTWSGNGAITTFAIKSSPVTLGSAFWSFFMLRPASAA